MIAEFANAIAELTIKAEQAETHGSDRSKAKAAKMRAEIATATERLATMPENVQRALAYRLQHRSGGYLHLTTDAADWAGLPAAYARGERYHEEPMPYKSLLD